MGYQVLPEVVLTTGADFAVFGIGFPGFDLKVGMFGMVEVQTIDAQPLNFMTVPSGPYVWRGILGYSLALSMDRWAEKILGERGEMEAVLSYRHESEHYTGSRFDPVPMFSDVPNIGDFLMPDLAVRKAIGPVDLEIRGQAKIFLPASKVQAYSVGPGGDLVFRWRALEFLHPFFSAFGEYLFGREVDWFGENRRINDLYLLRGLAGVIFPGETADLQIFFAAALGHGKGLLASNEEACFGWGIRIGFFKKSVL